MAFVVRITPKPPDQPPFGHLIDYSDNPNWRITGLESAKEWQLVLCHMEVTVGDHKCEFETHELAPEQFAIVCKSHPPRPKT